MKKLLSLVYLLIVAATVNAQSRKTVFVIVDGIPADVIEKLHTPVIDAIAKKGGFTKAMVGGEKGGYSQTPTISAVGYNTILTGVWANKHNVWDNDIAEPDYHYKTIFRLLKEQDSSKTTAIFSSWLDNRTKLVGDRLAATGNIPVDYHVDGLELDTLHFPHDADDSFMEAIDRTIADSAAAVIKNAAPDLSWVYLEYTDDMGHRHGDSPQFYRAVESMDKKLGLIWDAVTYRQKQFGEDWLVIVTTDHGRDAKTGKGHGGQSDRERSGWIATNAKHLNAHFKDSTVSIADIMPAIAEFMHISIPRADRMEIDGTSFIGELAATALTAHLTNSKVDIHWSPTRSKGTAKIWLSTTNQFKTGGHDEYTLAATVPLRAGKATIDVSDHPADFYKIVLETPVNLLNRWVLRSKR